MKKYGRTKQATDENTIRRMRFACCVPKATDTHTENVKLTAFVRQHCLHERASMLHLYVHCLSCSSRRLQSGGVCLAHFF